jgi:hypothetical protein
MIDRSTDAVSAAVVVVWFMSMKLQLVVTSRIRQCM